MKRDLPTSLKFKKGFSLVELLLTIALFSMVSISIASFTIDVARFSENRWSRIQSSLKSLESAQTAIILKNNPWRFIIDNTENGDKHIELINNVFEIADGLEISGNITTGFSIDNAYRDLSGNLVETGGTIDLNSRKISFKNEWTDSFGNLNLLNDFTYITNWNTKKIIEDTFDEFNSFQSKNSTIIINPASGDIILDQIFFPDWCRPTLGLNQYDIPGSATAKTVYALPGTAYLGTAGNSSGDSFTKLNISGVAPPVIGVEGTWDSYLVNNIFVDGNYAYLATTDDSREVVILDITVLPYSVVGTYNTPSSSNDANGVFVIGNTGFVVSGRYLYSFNVQNKASPTHIGSVRVVNNPNLGYWLTAKASKLIVRGNYAYVVLDQDWYELSIVNVTNPASMTVSSETSVNNQQAFDIAVSLDGTRTYFGTGSSSSEREFFILNTANKTSSAPIIGQYDTSGMSVKGVSIIANDGRAVLVGTSGEEYQALNILNEASPQKCGGLQFDSGINDIDSVTDAQGNAFSYIVTNNSTQDFLIIRGGPGSGGGSDGYGYEANGDYTSSVFDTQLVSPMFYTIEWGASLPPETAVSFQIRSGNSTDLSGEPWVGPDGSSATFFTNTVGEYIPTAVSGKRYIQYKAFLEASSTLEDTPTLNNIKIVYQ